MTSFVDVIRPANKTWTYPYNLLCVLSGSLFLALMSQIAIPLWFTPIPFSMQSFAVLLLGSILGSKRGSLAVICYLVEGFLGLPFFAGGTCGFAKLIGPTGGYFIGFVVCAYLVGFFLEKGGRFSFKGSFVALIIGSFSLLVCGLLWLSLYVGFEGALVLGVYPFLLGDLAKILLASSLIPAGWKFIK